MPVYIVPTNHSVAQVDLIYRNKVPPWERPIVDDPDEAYKILLDNWDINRIELVEQFKILLLNRKSACLGLSEVALGGMAACYVDSKIVFATALKSGASAIILAHNHPSGEVGPSVADKLLTAQLVAGGKILGIHVDDHLIVTPERYFSFRKEGLFP